MLANSQIIWIYVVVGFTPYSIKRRQAKGRHVLEVQALFWSLRYTQWQWTLHIPLIQRLRDSIWAVIKHLRDDGRSQE